MANKPRPIKLASAETLAEKIKNRKHISTMAVDDLVIIRDRMISADLTSGGVYTLDEINQELEQRECSISDGAKISTMIARLVINAPDGYCTYKDVFNMIRPGKKFIGHGSVSIAKSALRNVSRHAANTNTPTMAVLVRPINENSPTADAQVNIYNTCRGLGMHVGDNIDQFIEKETLAARTHAPIIAQKAA